MFWQNKLVINVINDGWRKAIILPYKHTIAPYVIAIASLPSQIAYGGWVVVVVNSLFHRIYYSLKCIAHAFTWLPKKFLCTVQSNPLTKYCPPVFCPEMMLFILIFWTIRTGIKYYEPQQFMAILQNIRTGIKYYEPHQFMVF